MAKGSARGIARERKVQDWLEERDWVVTRCAGSLGLYDLMAMSQDFGNLGKWLIEVKSTAQGPYERFGPKARADLRAVAERAGAQAWLAWWPPRGQLRWIPSSEWPP